MCICKNKLKFIKGKESIQYNRKRRRHGKEKKKAMHPKKEPLVCLIMFHFSFPNATNK
jgi:hypothetical protein